MTSIPFLSVRGLAKRYRRHAVLHDIDLDLRVGETTVLLGTNGSGKSTLLRCLLGLERCDAREHTLLGEDPRRAGDRALLRVGYVPDHPDIYPWMTANELYRFLAPSYPSWSAERTEQLSARLAFPCDRPFRELSRGEAAKALLVAALAHDPKLVVLDEAFARLAPPVRDEVLELFLEEAPLEHGAALVATHDLELAARLADRVLLLDGGRLVADVTPDELHTRPGTSGLPQRLRELFPGVAMNERRVA